jgi:hypothetical protein
MSQKELLINRLVDDEQRRHVDIKFLRGPREASEEDFCQEVNAALFQVRSGQAASEEAFEEDVTPVDWREVVNNL